MAEKYPGLLDRFLSYVKVETRSDPESNTIPTSPKELTLLKQLMAELSALGLSEVRMGEQNAIVMATLPSNLDHEVPVMGLLAHVDLSLIHI